MEESSEQSNVESKTESLRQLVLGDLQACAEIYLKALDEGFKGDKELCARSSAILGAVMEEKYRIPLLTAQNRQILEQPPEQQTFFQWRNAYHRIEGKKPERQNYLIVVIGGTKYYIDAVYNSLWSKDKKDSLIIEEITSEDELQKKYGLVPIDNYEQAKSTAQASGDREMVGFLNSIQQDREVLRGIESGQKRLLDVVSEDLRSFAVLQQIYPREGYGSDYLVINEKPVHMSYGNVRWIHEGVLYVFTRNGQLKVFSKSDAEGRDMKPKEAQGFLEQMQSSEDGGMQERLKEFPPIKVLHKTEGVSFEGDMVSWNVDWDKIGGKRYLLLADGKIEKLVKELALHGGQRDGLGHPTNYGIFREPITQAEEKEFMDKIESLSKYDKALQAFLDRPETP